MKILFDKDIVDIISYRQCIDLMENLIHSKLQGNVVHPPRDWFYNQKGSLVITKGELIKEQIAGFRVANTPRTGLPDCTQLTVTFDTNTGEMKGLIIGKLIGVYRTACINAVAIKHLSRQKSSVLGVIGTGFQARHHVLAALEVRNFDQVICYSRDRANCERFIHYVQNESAIADLEILRANSANELVEMSDVLICATNSSKPVFDSSFIGRGLHINGIGPKYEIRHELSIDAVRTADVICTDSIDQLYSNSGPGAVFWADTILRDKVIGLEHFISDYRRNESDVTYFCSMGLSGTEVAFANWIIESLN